MPLPVVTAPVKAVEIPEIPEISPVSEVNFPEPPIPLALTALPMIPLIPVVALMVRVAIPCEENRLVPLINSTLAAEFRVVVPRIPPLKPVAEMLLIEPVVVVKVFVPFMAAPS